MPKELTDIVLDEVTICFEPANEDARVEIIKAKNQTQILKETDMADKNDEGVEDVNIDELDDEVVEALKHDFDGLDFQGFVNMRANEELAEDAINHVIEQAEEAVGKMQKELDERDAVIAKMLPVVEQLGELDPKRTPTELIAQVKKMIDVQPDPEADITKGMSEEQKRNWHAMEAVAKAAETKEAIEKAKAIGVGKPEELADILTAVRKNKVTPEIADKLEALLKSAGAAIKKSALTRPLGVSGDAAPDGALAKAQAAAQEIRKSKPELSPSQALSEAWSQNPQLYEEYRASQGDQRAA